MADVVDNATRSRMMSGIQGRNTHPELTVRRYLHACGYRFRLHRRDLPGTPDLVLPRFRCAIYVHGCFWHRHAGCFYATSPATRRQFWRDKLEGNVARDRRQLKALNELGWRAVIVWECGLKHSLEFLYEILPLIEMGADVEEWPAQPPRVRRGQSDSD
ncbi:very short patch repair endonuclease [Kushneria aurantia]|uniref:Very short patch repair endonuclease n=1 Tax=Kushneria aurantia TaxID=504092 RepID=A0ABV6G3C6_9GAMM|nr:DNA mismatch endonuclease Vsr [Kushneria aurantia]